MSVLGSPPKYRAFIVILSFMLSKTDKKFSTKVLLTAKEAVRGLQEQTAEMEGALALLDLLNSETDGLFDKRIIRECSELMEVFNRLMHEQEALLRHMQMMQIADAKAQRQFTGFHKAYAASQKSNQTIKN